MPGLQDKGRIGRVSVTPVFRLSLRANPCNTEGGPREPLSTPSHLPATKVYGVPEYQKTNAPVGYNQVALLK